MILHNTPNFKKIKIKMTKGINAVILQDSALEILISFKHVCHVLLLWTPYQS